MLHVTCDLCGKEMGPGDDQRYVVKIGVFAAHDPGKITEADLEEDHMEAVSELLRAMEDNLEIPISSSRLTNIFGMICVRSAPRNFSATRSAKRRRKSSISAKISLSDLPLPALGWATVACEGCQRCGSLFGKRKHCCCEQAMPSTAEPVARQAPSDWLTAAGRFFRSVWQALTRNLTHRFYRLPVICA